MNTKAAKKTKFKANPLSWRFWFVLLLICLIYTGLIARTAYIQIVEPDMLKKQGDMRSLRISEMEVQRGSINDRNGIELAVSVPVQTVWTDPKVVMENDALAMKQHWQALADVLGEDANKLILKISENPKRRFLYIARQVSPSMADYVKELKIPGVYLRRESKRFYPTGEIAAHVIGFTNVDDQGIEGVEQLYDQHLTGEGGQTKYRKDAKGRQVEILSVDEPKPPQDITLSIDQRIQALAYRELKSAVKSFRATSGSVVVADVHTGEVLALVNSPSYNPNNRAGVPVHRFRNRAITDPFEPGSTMKPLTLLSAMEFGIADADTVVDTAPGWMRLGGRRVSDPINRGELTMADILIKSSNMGTTQLALQMPKEFFLDKFYEVGFGEPTGTGLLGETGGIYEEKRRSEFELATLSWG